MPEKRAPTSLIVISFRLKAEAKSWVLVICFFRRSVIACSDLSSAQLTPLSALIAGSFFGITSRRTDDENASRTMVNRFTLSAKANTNPSPKPHRFIARLWRSMKAVTVVSNHALTFFWIWTAGALTSGKASFTLESHVEGSFTSWGRCWRPYVQGDQKNYGLAAETSGRFFGRVRKGRPTRRTRRSGKPWEEFLTVRDKVTAELAKGDAAVMCDLQRRYEIIGYNARVTL